MTRHPLYERWRSMIQRCTNPKNPNFRRYGGRGIRVCPAWRASFNQFVADVGVPADLTLTLDRINNDGHYEPGNVRWASRREQALNRFDARTLPYRGKQVRVVDLESLAGEAAGVFRARVFRLGWSVERALRTVPDQRFGRSKHAKNVHRKYTATPAVGAAVSMTGAKC